MMAAIPLPVDSMTEKLVLATLVTWPRGLNGTGDIMESVDDILSDRCFTDNLSRELYKGVRLLYGEGREIDVISLREVVVQANVGTLKPSEVLDEIMTLQTSSVAGREDIQNLPDRARVLYEHHMRRTMIASYANEIKNLSESGDPFKSKDRVAALHEDIEPPSVAGEVVKMTDAGHLFVQNVIAAKQGVKNYYVFPWPEMGKYTIVPGNQVVVGARPGDGKTTMGVEMAKSAAKQGIPTLYITNEMLPEELAGRDMAVWSDINPYALDRGEVSTEQMQQMAAHIVEHYGNWCAASATNLRDLNMRIREFKKMMGIKKGQLWVLVFDYIQQVETGKHGTRNAAIEAMSKGIKEQALKDRRINLVMAQLRRKGDRSAKTATMDDLRDSGSIEQDADIIFLLTHPWNSGEQTFEDGTSTEGIVEINPVKGRKGSPVKNIRLGFENGRLFSLINEPIRPKRIEPAADPYQSREFRVEDL